MTEIVVIIYNNNNNKYNNNKFWLLSYIDIIIIFSDLLYFTFFRFISFLNYNLNTI